MTRRIPRNFSDFLETVYLVPDVETGKPIHPTLTPTVKAFWDYAVPEGTFRDKEIAFLAKKKRGKSLMAGALGIWTMALFPGSETYISLNSFEQGLGRAFRAMAYAIDNSPVLSAHFEVLKSRIRCNNGSTVEVLTSQAKSVSGHSGRLILVDEASYLTKDDETRWGELEPLPIDNAARLTTSYAGLSGYSTVLRRQWDAALAGDVPMSQFPSITHNQETGLIAFIETDADEAHWGYPTPERLAKIKANMQIGEFKRLWLNLWSAGSGTELVSEKDYQELIDSNLRALNVLNDSRVCYAGLDVGVTRASSGLVLTYPNDPFIDVLRAVEYAPRPNAEGKIEVDLDEIRVDIEYLYTRGQIKGLSYDPREASYLIQILQKSCPRLEFIKLEQNAARYRTDKQLVDAIRERRLRIAPGLHDLETHMLGTTTLTNKNGTRIERGTARQKNDLSVALAQAVDLCLSRTTFTPVQVNVYRGNPFIDGQTELDPAFSGIASKQTDLDSDSISPEILIPGSPDSVLSRQAQTKEKHGSGITWRNCRLRTKGCSVCEKELRRGGFYTSRDPDKWLAENRMKER